MEPRREGAVLSSTRVESARRFFEPATGSELGVGGWFRGFLSAKPASDGRTSPEKVVNDDRGPLWPRGVPAVCGSRGASSSASFRSSATSRRTRCSDASTACAPPPELASDALKRRDRRGVRWKRAAADCGSTFGSGELATCGRGAGSRGA